MTADLGPAATTRPVPSPEDRMADARTDTAFHRLGQQAAAIIQPAASFATYLDATERDQLDAKAATAEQERDEAQARVSELLAFIGANESLSRAAELTEELALARSERDDYRVARDVARQTADFYQGVNESLRQDLSDAGDVIAVVREAAERIDRALATYDTAPGPGQSLKHVSVLGTCIACGSRCPNGTCPNATPPSSVPSRRAQEGDRIEDGGVMGTLVRCRECGGGGLLHRPDVMPPARQPQESAEPPSSCPETVWDGPYSYRCGLGALGGVCGTHGRFRPAAEPTP